MNIEGLEAAFLKLGACICPDLKEGILCKIPLPETPKRVDMSIRAWRRNRYKYKLWYLVGNPHSL